MLNMNDCLFEKQAILDSIADIIESSKDEVINILCEIETYQTAINEVNKTIKAIRTYSKEDNIIKDRCPLGRIAVFLPFNMPLYSFVLYTFGAAYIGNEVIVRPSRLTGKQLKRICSLFKEKLQILKITIYNGSGMRLVNSIVEDNLFNCVIFTGKLESVKNIKEKISNNVKLIYCGSGVCPLIVRDDADIDAAVNIAIFSRLFNSGQDCLSTEKILVHGEVYDMFVSKLIDSLKQVHVEENTNQDAQIGKLIDQSIYENAISLLKQSNGSILYNGGYENQKINPIVIETYADEPVFIHEKFAPIFPIIRCDSNAIMVQIVNEADYILGVTVIGGEYPAGTFLASHVAYNISILSVEEEDAHVPFGGYKYSGFIFENGKVKEGPILFSVETSKLI